MPSGYTTINRSPWRRRTSRGQRQLKLEDLLANCAKVSTFTIALVWKYINSRRTSKLPIWNSCLSISFWRQSEKQGILNTLTQLRVGILIPGHYSVVLYAEMITGQMIFEGSTKQGAPTSLCQNPYNAILHVGHQNGTVSLWSPNSTTPLVKLLAHRGPVRSVAVDREGRYMVSAGQDLKLAVWDIRKLQEVDQYFLRHPGTSIAISDRGLAAVGAGTQLSIWKGLFQEKAQRPYMAW